MPFNISSAAVSTRASLAAFEKWNPDVFVDLHTTDGSFHGYALTYAPSLNPAAREAGAYTRDSLLPELRRRMKARDGFEVIVIPTFTLDGQDVRSSSIRAAIASGDLSGAARLLGRPVSITGSLGDVRDGWTRIACTLPIALPPEGDYPVTVDGRLSTLRIEGGEAWLQDETSGRRVTVVLTPA